MNLGPLTAMRCSIAADEIARVERQIKAGNPPPGREIAEAIREAVACYRLILAAEREASLARAALEAKRHQEHVARMNSRDYSGVN